MWNLENDLELEAARARVRELERSRREARAPARLVVDVPAFADPSFTLNMWEAGIQALIRRYGRGALLRFHAGANNINAEIDYDPKQAPSEIRGERSSAPEGIDPRATTTTTNRP